MNKNEFQELVQSGLGRAIIYARENDVQSFRDVILDACLHCYSADAQCEGTRAGYMLDLVNLLPERQFYCDEVLKALPGSEDDWDAAQRYHFAAFMSLDGDDRAKQVMYESFEPGPRMGEAIAIDFLQMDGLKGLLFAAAKIGGLLISKPDEVDVGWLWMQAKEICGEQEARASLSQAGATDPSIEAYRWQPWPTRRKAVAARWKKSRRWAMSSYGRSYSVCGPSGLVYGVNTRAHMTSNAPHTA